MDIYRKKLIWKLLLLLFAVLIGLASLIYTQSLITLLKNQEKKKVALWAEATTRLVGVSLESNDFSFLFSVIEDNNTVPVILTDGELSIISSRNLPASVTDNSAAMRRELGKMKEKNPPIVIDLGDGTHNFIYYRESTVLRKLIVYPYVQLGIVLLFIIIAYMAFSASRQAEQNQVWVGLSKETAHQLGTPVSSLSAWVELFETRYPGSEEVKDLSEDVERLDRVTERFSLIGSKPKLQDTDVKSLVFTIIEYLKKRTASTVEFRINADDSGKFVAPANGVLVGWVVENLIKNSIDAIQGNGVITINLCSEKESVIIDIEDTGKGIVKKDFKNVFKPGFSTRERGWGLGLSLSKRIIEEYHKGRIFVKHSSPGKGTCMRVILKSTRA